MLTNNYPIGIMILQQFGVEVVDLNCIKGKKKLGCSINANELINLFFIIKLIIN